MGDIFLTSDTHFCHQRSFLWQPRGFESVEEMNETIVEKWNKLISKNQGHIIYHLGDLCLSDTEAAIPYIQNLNGHIIWIRGNHDGDNRVKIILENCPNIEMLNSYDWNTSWATVLKDKKWRFYLSHYPTKVANYDDEGSHKTWCLCGHTHTTDKWLDIKNSCYHVEMDAHNCYPVALDQIKDEIQSLKI